MRDKLKVPSGLTVVKKGDKVKFGDVFIDGDKSFVVDNTGRILGITVLGIEVTKEGGFFRKDEHSHKE